jgi:hypothetical protein
MASFGPLLIAIRPKSLYNFRTTAMFPILHLTKLLPQEMSHIPYKCHQCRSYIIILSVCCVVTTECRKLDLRHWKKTSNSIVAIPCTVKIGLKCLKVKKDTQIHTLKTCGFHKRNFILFSLKSRLKLHVLKLYFSYKNRSHGFWKSIK